jgi:hypothetical protein
VDVQEIDLVIEKDGQVHLHVRGVKGTSCRELTAEVEVVLGGTVASRQMTHEAYENADGTLPLQQRQQQG